MKQDSQPSLIETMKADAEGMIALMHYHLRRLTYSAQALGYPYPGDKAVIAAIKVALHQAGDAASGLTSASKATPYSESNKLSGTRVRLLLSPLGQLDIQTAPLPALQGVPFVALTSLRLESAEPLLQHKTTHRPWYDATTQWLTQHPNYFDLIFLNEKGELCEGSRSNIYIMKDTEWLTPPLSSGLLGGVLRTQLLETGQAKEATLTPSDLTADKASIRLSNALRGWFDVQLDPSLLPGRLLP
ncbi:MAG: aminotransferase class IV family protein [Burkholderiaceae bacterium]|nr:aminotransferase class IV family protein [Burkholderiaceae bacterium]